MKLFWVGDDTSPQNIKIQKNDADEENHDLSYDDFSDVEEVGQIALDVLESHQALYILAPVAWIELSEIDISIKDNVLTISGLRKRPKEFYEYEMRVKNEECFWGRFKRNIILSENMDLSKVEAVMENNLLVIHIPKIRFDSTSVKINKIES